MITNRLKALALSETGFLFDPVTGHTYTLNSTGTRILDLLRKGISEPDLSSVIAKEYSIGNSEAAIDCSEFVKTLREYRLLD